MKWRAHLFMVQHSSAPGPKRNRGPLANSARAAKNVIYASVCMGRKKQPSLPKPINPSKRLPHRAPVAACFFGFKFPLRGRVERCYFLRNLQTKFRQRDIELWCTLNCARALRRKKAPSNLQNGWALWVIYLSVLLSGGIRCFRRPPPPVGGTEFGRTVD